MQVAFVQVGGDDDLESVAPHFMGQLHADLVAPLRGNFSRFEALIAMPGDIVVLFAIPLFCQDHLLQSRLLQAVDGGNEKEQSAVFCGFWMYENTLKKSSVPLGTVFSGFST